MSKSFGSRELTKCLEKLGFKLARQTSSHLIYNPPKNKIVPEGIRPFMTVQVGRKTYDRYSANRYISQVKKFGFSKKEIEKNL